MATLNVGPVHHIRLSVTDLDRSRAFYTEVLGFEVAMDSLPPEDDPHYESLKYNLQDGIVLANAGIFIGLRATDAARTDARDSFDPFRVGLDHLSFSVESKSALEEAAKIMDDMGVTRSEISDLVPFGIALLPFRDPDGIQLELTAPL